MKATAKQVRLIEKLHNFGAPIPCDEDGEPDFSMYDSIAAADAYIKQWIQLLPRRSYVGTTTLRMDEWGGIPNC